MDFDHQESGWPARALPSYVAIATSPQERARCGVMMRVPVRSRPGATAPAKAPSVRCSCPKSRIEAPIEPVPAKVPWHRVLSRTASSPSDLVTHHSPPRRRRVGRARAVLHARRLDGLLPGGAGGAAARRAGGGGAARHGAAVLVCTCACMLGAGSPRLQLYIHSYGSLPYYSMGGGGA
eukprot:COSAG05_NODE_1929_length_3819_cov_16.551882_3_plen_179_part_00